MMTDKIIIACVVVILALTAYTFYLRENIATLKANVEMVELSNNSLQLALEQEKKTSIALITQIEGLYTAQNKYISEIERNRRLIAKSKQVDLDKTKVVDNETLHDAIDIINDTFGLRKDNPDSGSATTQAMPQAK